MATHDSVVQAFEALAKALSALSKKVADPRDQARVASIAATVSDVAETFDVADPATTSDRFDAPVAAAAAATVKANTAAADPTSIPVDAAVSAADRAQLSLQDVTPKPVTPAGLVGMLRVAPSAALSFSASNSTVQAGDQSYGISGRKPAATKDDAKADPGKPYISSLVLLFPTEAVTLFPLGQGIARGDGGALALVIVAVALFVAVLRYFGTKDPATGVPAWNEICVSQISFLLWVGAIGGYEATHPLIKYVPFDSATTRSLFGFVIIMWVSLAPFFVAAKSKKPRDRGNAKPA